MRIDRIAAVGIGYDGSLWVKPATEVFPQIYREGMEVSWDSVRLCLYSPKPREWSYLVWFVQIRDAARAQGVNLEVGPTTLWTEIAPDLKAAIMNNATAKGCSF